MASTFPHPNLALPSKSSEPKTRPRRPFSLPLDDNHSQATEPDYEPLAPKPKASAQLKRWSMARTIRSGRRLDRPVNRTDRIDTASLPPKEKWPIVSGEKGDEREDDDGDGDGALTEGKAIYMVSDGTGWTAEHSVNAALGQFESCLADRGCAVNTHLFSGIDEVDRLIEIIKQAAKEGALLLYTLADPTMADSAKHACHLWGVPSADILGPTTEAIATHLGVSPSGIPRGAPGRKIPLTKEYFKRIEAIDFTIKQDDGAQPQNLNRADVVLVGVSRTGKTPLSIYLAQKGYKVANVPIVMGVQLPEALFQIDQKKIFGLTINHVVLQAIRRARANGLGFDSDMRSKYSDMDHVREELEFASKLFAQNPAWPVIGVTGKAIEETAAVLVRIFHDRMEKCSMPGISKQY